MSTEEKQVAFCARCLRSSNMKGKDLLYFDDISELNDSEVLNNWPILEDQNTLYVLQSILEQKEDQEDYLLTIEQFIDNMQNKINQKLIRIKKDVINYFSESFICKQKLISKYNEISFKQELKNSLQLMMEGNQDGLEQIEIIMKKCNEKKKENQQILLDHIQKYQANQKFLELKFPKMLEKQLFQNIKLIKRHLLSKVLKQNKNFIFSFKDYLSECSSAFNQDTEIQFSQLSNQQFEFLIKTAQFHIYRNQQLSKLDKNNLKDQNDNIIEQLERINKEHKSLVSQFYTKEQQQFQELLAMHECEKDASQKYPFKKSLIDSFSQNNQIIKKNEEGLIKIKQINSQWVVQFFTENAIDASKKYTIQIEIKPFKDEENRYKIAIGFIPKSLCDEQWLDSDISSCSSLYVSNYDKNKFTLNKKGMLLNNNLINRSILMRKLEIQFCLKEKFFQIADFPDYNNITQAREDEILRQFDGQEYVFGMKHYSVKSIKVLKFTEGVMQLN